MYAVCETVLTVTKGKLVIIIIKTLPNDKVPSVKHAFLRAKWAMGRLKMHLLPLFRLAVD